MTYSICGIDIKLIQNEQLLILIEFDRICKKHYIPYQLMAGTLLGCIRHKGFIPWDDDIDVCMIRKDYDIFIEACKKDLDSSFFLQTFKTDKNYTKQFAKIRKNNTLFVEKLSSDLNIHHGIYIDIFPLDNVFPKTLKGLIQEKLLYLFTRLNLARSKSICINTNNIVIRNLRLMFYYLLKLVPKNFTNLLQKKIATIFNNKHANYVSHLTNGLSKNRYNKFLRKKDSFYLMQEGEFEGYKLPIPTNYDEILTRIYGNYMDIPEINERKPHHGVINVKL